MRKAVIVFSGYNQRAVLSFLRVCERNNIEYAIIASSADDTIFSTTYAQKVFAARQNKALDINEISGLLNQIRTKLEADEYIIAPSTEALNRFLLEHVDKFSRLRCTVPLVNKHLYERISDKRKFTDLCVEVGLNVPREYEDVNRAKLPYVAKPKKYITDNGRVLSPILVTTNHQHDELQKSGNADAYYYQQMIGGRSLYLLYYFSKDGTVAKLSQENLVQQPKGKSMLASKVVDLHRFDITQQYEDLFKSLNFFGFVMVEVKLVDNEFYMIEANPRFWGPSQLFIDAGVDMFSWFLADNGIGNKPEMSSVVNLSTKYFWYGGLVDTLISGEPPVYHNYGSDDLAVNLSDWLNHDVYCRKDSINIFTRETHII